MSGDPDTAAGRFDWERLLRRCRIKATAKHVGLTLATYANGDGTRAHPGVEQLAEDCSLSERAVRDALRVLRDDLGLITRTARGSTQGRRALADVYRLTIPADLLERIDLLLPPRAPAAGADVPGSPERGAGDVTGAPAPRSGDVTGTPATRSGDRAEQRNDVPVIAEEHWHLRTDHRHLTTGSPERGSPYQPKTRPRDHEEGVTYVAEPPDARASDDTDADTFARLARIDDMRAAGASPEQIDAFLADTRAAS